MTQGRRSGSADLPLHSGHAAYLAWVCDPRKRSLGLQQVPALLDTSQHLAALDVLAAMIAGEGCTMLR